MSSSDQPRVSIADPEVLAFIHRTESFYPDGAVEMTIAEQRRLYDKMAAAFRQPRPDGVAVTNSTLDGPVGALAVRHYNVENSRVPRVLFFHGGGFVVGGLDSHDDVCAEIALRCEIDVISTEYRLCPEHPHPAAYEDTLAAIDHASDRPVILVGDSAGANLAAAAALTRHAALVGQVLIYPGLGGEVLGLRSYSEHAEAPLLTTADIHAYHRLRLDGSTAASDPTAAPLLADDLSGLPPCFVSAAECDPLCDDGVEFVRRLQAAGVSAEISIEAQLPHGHLRARTCSKRASAAFDRIILAISKMAAQR